MTEDPWAIAQKIDAAFHARDLPALAAFWAEDIEYETPDVALKGRAARIQAEAAVLNAFADAQITERRHLVSDDFILIEGSLSGTHTGPLRVGNQSVPPTGRRIATDYAALLWLENGLVKRQRLYFDRLALAQGLGLIPAVVETA